MITAATLQAESALGGENTCHDEIPEEVTMLQTELQLRVRRQVAGAAGGNNGSGAASEVHDGAGLGASSRTPAEMITLAGNRKEAIAVDSSIKTEAHAGTQIKAGASKKQESLVTATIEAEDILGTLRDFVPILFVLLVLVLLALLMMTLGSHWSGDIEVAKGAAAGSMLLMDAGLPTQKADAAPPAICPSLILPNTEARFMISLHSITTADMFEIRGTSGRKLLTAAFSGGVPGQRQQLALACVGCENDPRCTVAVEGQKLSVLGRRREPYGEMEKMDASLGTGAVLKCAGAAVMLVEVLDRSRLHVVVSTPGKRLLAEGQCRAGGSRPPAEGHGWQLEVKPGADAVLILSSILSVARLWET